MEARLDRRADTHARRYNASEAASVSNAPPQMRSSHNAPDFFNNLTACEPSRAWPNITTKSEPAETRSRITYCSSWGCAGSINCGRNAEKKIALWVRHGHQEAFEADRPRCCGTGSSSEGVLHLRRIGDDIRPAEMGWVADGQVSDIHRSRPATF